MIKILTKYLKVLLLVLFIFSVNLNAQNSYGVKEFSIPISTDEKRMISWNETIEETLEKGLHESYDTTTGQLMRNDSTYANSFGYWFGFGIGNSYYGPLLQVSFYYRYKKNLFSLRYLNANEFRFNPGGSDYDEPPLSFREIGFLYGRYIKHEKIHFIIAGGLGFIDVIDRGDKISEKKYEKIELSSICFPIEVSFKIAITNYFGIGATFVSNLNAHKNINAGMIEIYLGKFTNEL